MAEFKEISPNAPLAEQALNWVDNRFIRCKSGVNASGRRADRTPALSGVHQV